METIRFTASSLPLMALFGPHAMSDVSPECAPKRTSADHSEFMGSRPSQRASRRLVTLQNRIQVETHAVVD